MRDRGRRRRGSGQGLDPDVCESRPFRRGDCNAHAKLEISDSVFGLGALFLGTKRPSCPRACDANDDGDLDISVMIFLLQHQFLGRRALPEPFSSCGQDATMDGLDCRTYAPCAP